MAVVYTVSSIGACVQRSLGEHRGHTFGFSTTQSCAPEPQHDDKSEVVRATAQQGGGSKPTEKDAAPSSDIVGGVSKSCSPCKPTFAIETEAERATFGVMIAVSNAVVVGSAASSS